ncbi:hypothetical protein [Streptomyces sp. NPDC005760]|uniref:hypothetical protein n=1 Tax=Streptomyces sp. NPDC005760 TaxID=3156718 RepID=UPI0033F63CC3
MTFHYTDPDGDHLSIGAGRCDLTTGQPLYPLPGKNVITLAVTGLRGNVGVYIPVDQVEELIAGIRDTARQAATQEQP